MRRREKNRKLHRRLEDWGQYENQPVIGLGYSSQTHEAKMMEMGTVCSSGNAAVAVVPQFRPNKICAETGIGVLALSTKLRTAIIFTYQNPTKREDIFNKTGMKIRDYHRNLKEAELFLAGFLGYKWED